jgi:hypothetical protein
VKKRRKRWAARSRPNGWQLQSKAFPVGSQNRPPFQAFKILIKHSKNIPRIGNFLFMPGGKELEGFYLTSLRPFSHPSRSHLPQVLRCQNRGLLVAPGFATCEGKKHYYLASRFSALLQIHNKSHVAGLSRAVPAQLRSCSCETALGKLRTSGKTSPSSGYEVGTLPVYYSSCYTSEAVYAAGSLVRNRFHTPHLISGHTAFCLG